MTDTPRLSLPLLAAGQAQKHVTHNDALMRLDALIHLVVDSRTQAAPPASPTELSAYIVPPGGTGAFAGRADQVALFEDGGWTFLTPRSGWQAWVADEEEHNLWAGTEWRRASPLSGLGAERWGVNATADTTNRLAVSADASLFNHAGSDHRLKLNKAGAGNTASLLFQSDWSGRAEFGLAGDDDFRVKVSADGSAWHDALAIDRATGGVALPGSPWAGGQNLLVNGDMAINQRGFAGGVLAAGAYGFDRWKAATGGANLSLSGFTVTLSSGAIVQPVEPALWGLSSFAGLPLSLSVEELAGGSLSVAIGSQTGTIAADTGRRSLTLTPAVGDTGALQIRLSPSAGAVSFARIKLERGRIATGWVARPLTVEQMLCRRYHWRPDGQVLIDAYQAGAAASRQSIGLPVSMRTTPSVGFSVSQEINVQGADRGVLVQSPERAYAYVTAQALGRVRAAFDAIAFDAEL
ncbi:DUF2793 domain-containing protein [Bosea sp. NBC_00550]|uniref:DUF2793 domain-containing protein n=1 Tax=Bosea sp. NBC_00550 TaxID=2969621 RepID=UPI0022324F58|nr:DUF2793 domain-containing protein [Bosea sp. NBC_00550]UZF94163.1 DUF2793 domain-containing protein [Bosea sp. NBC_00550]